MNSTCGQAPALVPQRERMHAADWLWAVLTCVLVEMDAVGEKETRQGSSSSTSLKITFLYDDEGVAPASLKCRGIIISVSFR